MNALNKNKLVKNPESSNCIIASSQIRIKCEFVSQGVDRMHPWRPRRISKPIKSPNSLVGTKAFIKDS